MAGEIEWWLLSRSSCMKCDCSSGNGALFDGCEMVMFCGVGRLELGEDCPTTVVWENRRGGGWDMESGKGASKPNTCRAPPLVTRFLGDMRVSPFRGDLREEEEGRGGRWREEDGRRYYRPVAILVKALPPKYPPSSPGGSWPRKRTLHSLKILHHRGSHIGEALQRPTLA